MAKNIDKAAVGAEIKDLYKDIDKCIGDLVFARSKHDQRGISDAHWKMETLMVNTQQVLSYILDTLEVKEVEEETESIWHDANQRPTMYRKYLVRYSDDRVSGSWERHDDGFIPWKDVVKEHGFTHWCYVEDLIKL